MTETFIELTEEAFDEQYALVQNHLNPSASWAYGESGGCLFETYGDEFAFVRQCDPRTVWTLVDGNDGDMYLVSGLHYVNRIGYLVSRDPIEENTTVQVHLPMQTDE